MQREKEIIVLGGNGFLGKNLCECLRQYGIGLHVLDKSLGCDLTTDDGQKQFSSILDSVHVDVDIVMMAAQLGASLFESTPIAPFYYNSLVNQRCIQTILQHADKVQTHVTFYSTSEVYGNSGLSGFKSAGALYVDPAYGRSLYAQEKLVAETILNSLRQKGAIASLRVLRPFNVSGKHQKRGVVYEMVKSAIQDHTIFYAKDQSRDITFVQDATQYAIDMILSRQDGMFDVTSHNHIMLKDLAYCIKGAMHRIQQMTDINVCIKEMPYTKQYIQTRGIDCVMHSNAQLTSFIEKLVQHNTICDIAEELLK